MHKGGYRCRCSKCEARRTLRKHPDEYIRSPKCGCGSKQWRVDRWRMRVELQRAPCTCLGGYYPFPHRRGSKWCEHNPGWTPDDAQAEFGVEADQSWRTDPLSFGQRPTKSVEPPF